MKVRITFDVSSDERRAIAAYYGREGMASRDTVANFLQGHALADLETVYSDWEENNNDDLSDPDRKSVNCA